jgi:hypothetical protein
MNTGPAGGPKDFDIAFPFDEPFLFDPRTGDNLLVEMQFPEPWHSVGTDENLGTGNEPATIVFGIDTEAEVATWRQFSEVPHQFIFESSLVLMPGDADQNLSFDQLDLVQVLQAAKYTTGEPATWGEGDWDGAPGGEPGSPPLGNGVFDQLDVVSALATGLYMTGPYIETDGADTLPAPVPEPSTVVLSAMALVGLLVRPVRWRSSPVLH